MDTYNPTLNVFEAEFTSERDFTDPIREVALSITFSGPDAEEHTVDAFWDGARTWRVRFSPPIAGEWQYVSSASSANADGLDGQSGSFTVAPYSDDIPQLRHGPVRVADDGYSLAYADGTPYFWLADTAWNGVLKAQPDDWGRYLSTRKEQGFTAIQAVITHWRSFPHDVAGEMAFDEMAAIHINPAFYQRIDDKIAAIAGHGLVPAPVLIWACTPKDPGHYLPAEDCILLARYEVARYAAYRPIWILGGDGDYRGEAAEKWKETGRAVFGDSGKEVVTMHPGGIHWPNEELRAEPWLSFLSYQSGHGDNDDHLRWLQSGPPATNWSIEPVKPVINQEPNYEHHVSYHKRQVFDAYHVRRASYWSLLVSPTAGVTYGHHGIWPWMEEVGIPADHGKTGEAPPWHVSLLAEGAENMRHLRNFFEGISWWTLRPAQDLLAEQPGKDDPNNFVAAASSAESGKVVIYTPIGGTIQLTQALENVRWYNPRNGIWQDAGGTMAFATPDDTDWLLVGETA